MSGDLISADTHTNLGRVDDVISLLAVLDVAGATVFIEGTTSAEAVRSALVTRKTTPVRDDLSGTIWPRSTGYHVELTEELVIVLRDLASRHAQPELFDHLVVYRDDLILLAAYDAGMDDVWVSRDLPAETVDRLRGAKRSAET